MMVGALVPLPGTHLLFLDGILDVDPARRPVQVTTCDTRHNARVFFHGQHFDGHYCRPFALCCTPEPAGDVIVIPGLMYIEISAGIAHDVPTGRRFACRLYCSSDRPNSPQLQGFDGDWLRWHWTIPPASSRGRNAVTIVSTSFSPYDCRICLKPAGDARRLTVKNKNPCEVEEFEFGSKACVSLVALSSFEGLLFARLQGSRDVSILTRERHTAPLGNAKISNGVIVELAWIQACSSGSLRQSWCGTSPMYPTMISCGSSKASRRPSLE